jgi:hypothetical protein
MLPAVRSTLDVALWLLTRADFAGERLQPQKLQRLMYLAQAHYAGNGRGGKLMPATFLATDLGPIESNVYYLFEAGMPQVPMEGPPRSVSTGLPRASAPPSGFRAGSSRPRAARQSRPSPPDLRRLAPSNRGTKTSPARASLPISSLTPS